MDKNSLGLDSLFRADEQQQVERSRVKARSSVADIDGILSQEGAEHLKPIVQALYGQESGSGANQATSVDGAQGGMQIIPATFQRYAKPGERIDSDNDNFRVGVRIIKDLATKFGNDPAKIATGYFSGEGNVNAGQGSAWKRDARDGNGKSVSGYVSDVVKRVGGQPEKQSGLPDLDKAPTWAQITQNAEYASLTAAEKAEAKAAYFDYWIAPHAGGERDKMRGQFLSQKDATAPNEGAGMMSDAGNLLGIGLNSMTQNVRELVGRVPLVGESIVKGVDAADKYLTGRSSEEILKSNVKDAQARLSPEMQAAGEKKWWDSEAGTFGDAWKDPLAYASGVLQSLPEQVVTMFPAMRLAKGIYASKIAAGVAPEVAAVAAAGAAKTVGRVSEGALGGAASSRDVRDKIMAMTPEQLQGSEAMQALMSQGMSFDAARQQIANDSATQAFIASGLVTGAFGGYGDQILAKAITSGLGKNILTRVGKGVVGEGLLEEFPQEFGSAVAENAALRRADGSIGLTDDALNRALGGAATGGLQGGAMTAFGRSEAPAAKPTVTPDGRLESNDPPPPGAPAPLDVPPTVQSADAIVRELAAQAGIPESTVLPTAAPVETGAPEAVGDQDVLDFAGVRLEQLRAKRDGTMETIMGPDGPVDQDVPAVALSRSESQELDALEQAQGNPQALRTLYGFDQQETQNVQEQTESALNGLAPSQNLGQADAAQDPGLDAPAEAPDAGLRQEVGQPAQGAKKTGLGFKEAFGSLSGGGMTQDFYGRAFAALQAGKDTISGVKDPILARAKSAFDAGLIKSADDLRQFEQKGAYPTGAQPRPQTPAKADLSGRSDAELREQLRNAKDGAVRSAINAELAKRKAAAEAAAPTPQASEKAVNEIVEIKDVNGVTHRVKKADLDGPRTIIPTYTKNGAKKPNGGINRGNIDLNGDAQKASEAEVMSNPMFDVVTADDNKTFKTKESAKAYATKRGFSNTHDVVEAGSVQDGITGYVLKKKQQPNSEKEANQAKDYTGKWFGTAQKAQDFIAKQRIGDTHEAVQAGPSRFEIKRKEQQQNGPQATETQQAEAQGSEAPAAGAVEPKQPPQADTKLPKNLEKSKPRYAFGSNQYTLSFESDVDKAAYITAGKEKSKRDADFIRFVADATGLSDEAVIAHGNAVKEAIKGIVKPLQGTEHDKAISVPRQAVGGEVAKPKQEESKYTPVGTNQDGKTLVKDKNGVRSYVEDGVRIQEPVSMRPTRDGMEVSGANRRDEFKTVEELAEQNGSTKSQAVQDFIEGKRDDVPTLEEVKAEQAKNPQPGEPGYTLKMAEADLDAMLTNTGESGRVENDRLSDRIKRQEKLIAEMKAEQAANDGGKQGRKAGDILFNQYGEPYRIESESVGEVKLTKNPNQMSEKVVRMDSATFENLVKQDDQFRRESIEANTPKAELAAKPDDFNAMFDDVLAEEVAKDAAAKPKTEREAKAQIDAPQEPRLAAAKALIEEAKAATGNAKAEAEVRRKARELAQITPISDEKTVLALDMIATRLGMGDGNKKDLDFAPAPKTEKESKAQRTATESLTSAAKNTAAGLDAAIDGLGKLFGGPGRLNSGLSFDEETYAKAKPLFQQAIANLKDASSDLKEAMRTVVRMVLDKFGAQAAQNMKPYVVRFIEETASQAQNAQKETPNDSPVTTNPTALDNPLDAGQRPQGEETPARGAAIPRDGDGRPDDRSVRGSGGRTEGANDEGQDLGDGARDDTVSAGQNDAVAGSGGRVSTDFRPAAGGLDREGSWFDTAKRNIDLIEKAIQIEKEGRTATPDEQALLSKYVGFGAGEIRNKLFPVPPDYLKRQDPDRLIWPSQVEARWKPLAERIEALPRAWQKSVLQSSQYAHYTSENIIRSMWSAMQRMGFTGGKVFEPGMGIGSFSMLMPDSVRQTSNYTGVEFDGPTALIARLLSPEQNMLHDDFIKRKFPKNFFDVAIGNPPFSQTKVLGDPDYEKFGFMLHDFFFAKSIDRVRPGGLLAFVTSKGTMDKQSDKARKYLADRADLLGAIRLPSTAFEGNAGTSVVTDVIFLRKRMDGEAPAGEAWNNIATIETKDGTVAVNEYFAKHPEMVLGQQRISGNVDDEGRRINSNGRGGEKYTVVSYDKTPAELDAKFSQAIERLPVNAYSPLGQSSESLKREVAKVDFDPSVKREGVVYLAKDGTLMRVEQGVGKPLADMMKLTEADKPWFKGYIGLRDMVQSARLAQATAGDWESALKAINKAYDAFRKEHGPINDFRVQVRKSTDEDGNVVENEFRVFKNRRRFREDYDAAMVTQLEAISESGEIVKGPFLLGRTIGKPITREVKTIGDALAVSLDSVGNLDLDDVAKRINLSKEETIDALGSQIYMAPGGDWQLSDEYLSGDVVSKLEEAEQAARIDPTLRRNVEALKEVQPEKLGPSQISAKLGASWVPESHVNEFAQEIGAGAVSFDTKTESWQVEGGNQRTGRTASAEYGTASRSPSELLEAALNSRSVKVMKTLEDKKTVVDQEATAAANEVLKKIKDKFKGWIWTDSERATELVESYNKRYNNIAPRRFDGSHMTLPGVSLRFKLHPHQLRAIWRMVQTGNTYLAHAVGAGKTIEMIAGGMEQKRLGLIKKPIYVVPNHMLEQFSNEFMELYPLANIMVADDENFSAERRKAFIASATLNNPDAIVITHEAYKRIGVKEESVGPIRDEILTDLELELSGLAKDQGARVRRSQLEQQIEAVTQRFDRIINASGKDSTIKFEDIGVDFVFADEAHVYRKLDFHTSQQIKGIDPNGSKAALDMYVKTRWLEKQRPGRSMVFASGTPVTNTMGELYTIMRFFAQGELDRAGISTFDAWSRQFGEVVPALEPNAAGKYELIERFAKFDNVPELMSRVRQFMDVLTSESLGTLVKRPDLKGGKPNLNIVESNDSLRQYMETELAQRIEISKNWKPSKDEPNNPDPIVAIITDGRFAALDPRFFGGALKEGERSILMEMADKIVAEHKATAGNVYLDKQGKPEPLKGGTQIVFYNLGFGESSQAARGFNARATFTKYLTDGGIPRDQIAWFDEANTDAKKEAVFKDVRAGKIRVLIGSAKKMGTGVNVQKRLTTLHYQDPPWYPADVEQPHGRIIRQGNQNNEVAIEWYTTKGTYQSTMWQMVGRKQRFIDQAFTGDKSLRSMDDMGEASLFEQAAAVASGDPRAIQLAGLRQDVERLERLQKAHASEQISVRSELHSAEWYIDHYGKTIDRLATAFKAIGEKYYSFTKGTVGKSEYDKQSEFGQALKDAFNSQAKEMLAEGDVDAKATIATLPNGVEVIVEPQVDNKDKMSGSFSLRVRVENEQIRVAEGSAFGESVDALGLARRVLNAVNGIEQELNKTRSNKTEQEQKAAKLRKKFGAPFEYQQELAEKYGELKALETQLAEEGKQKPAAAEPVIREDGTAEGDATPGPREFNDLSTSPAAAFTSTPEEVRANALPKLKSLERKRDANKITEAEYRLGVQQLIGKLEQRNEAREERSMETGRRRGADWIMSQLRKGVANDTIPRNEADFADWLLKQNLNLANDLGISISGKDGDGTAGNYNPFARVIKLFTSANLGNGTAVHEILHHTERMMPGDVQAGLMKAWQRAWDAAYKAGDAKLKAALNDMLAASLGDKEAHSRTKAAFASGSLQYDEHYQLFSPSEFWAVNATRILSGRFEAKGSWVARAVQWFKEFVQRAKAVFGLKSDAPILKALDAVMRGEGVFQPKAQMLSERVFEGSEPGAIVYDDIVRNVQNNVIQFFGNRKDTLKTFGVYHKTLATQYHKALKDRDFGRVFNLSLDMQNAVSQVAIRPAELAPGILPRVDDVKSALKTVWKGKKASADLDAATKAIFAGTLAGANVMQGRVFTEEELRTRFKMTDTGVALYKQAREAIDASLDEVAASEAYAMAHGFITKSLRASILANPQNAPAIMGEAFDRQIRMLKAAIKAAKAVGNEQQQEQLQGSLKGYIDTQRTIEKIFLTAKNLKLAGYAPLMRFGKYTVTVQAIDPTTGNLLRDENGDSITEFYGQYETEGEAISVRNQKEALYKSREDLRVTAGTKSQTAHELYAGISPETLALFADAVGAGEAMKKYYQLALTERSALKRRLDRKGIDGFSEDMPRVLSNFITSNARFAAQRYYQRDLNNAIKFIPKEKGDVLDEAMALKKFLNDPNDPAAPVSAAMFAWFLGGSVASAMVNLTQPLLMTAPYLSQHGVGRATSAIAKAMPYALGKKQITDEALRDALKQASQEGIVDAQEIFHLYSVGAQGVATGLTNALARLPGVGGKIKAGSESARARINAFLTLWGSMFSVAEGFNRRLTFLAAWEVAKAKGETNPYAFAVKAVNETQGVYNKVNRPNWARGPVGRTVLTFKQFSITYVELLSRMWKRGGPEGKRAALMMLAMLMLAAGEEGLPFAQDLDDLIDTVGQMFGFDTNMRRNKRRLAHEILGKTGGDLFLYGISSQWPLDFAGRLGLGNMIPGTGILKPSDKELLGRNVAEVLGPAAGMAGQIADAYDAFTEGNQKKALQNLAPKAIKDVMAGLEMSDKGYATDAKGRKTTDVTAGEAAIKAVGFNPTTVAQLTRKTMPIQQDVALQRRTETAILDQWVRGISDNDQEMVAKAQARLEEWNQANPDTPIQITGAQIKSRIRNQGTDKETRILKSTPKEMRGRVAEGLDTLD